MLIGKPNKAKVSQINQKYVTPEGGYHIVSASELTGKDTWYVRELFQAKQSW